MEFFERDQARTAVTRDLLISILLRFGVTLAAIVAVGALVYRGALLQRHDPAFQFISIGALAAAILTFVRLARPTVVLALVLGFGMFRLGLAQSFGWLVGISGLLLGGGLFLVSLIYDLLAAQGWRFGKWIASGPLLGGLFLALAPLLEFHEMNPFDAGRTLLRHASVGLGIGVGLGLGMELAERLLPPRDPDALEPRG